MASGCVIWGSNTIRQQLVALGLLNSKGGVVTGQSLARLIGVGKPRTITAWKNKCPYVNLPREDVDTI